jgi:hypothetical protein
LFVPSGLSLICAAFSALHSADTRGSVFFTMRTRWPAGPSSVTVLDARCGTGRDNAALEAAALAAAMKAEVKEEDEYEEEADDDDDDDDENEEDEEEEEAPESCGDFLEHSCERPFGATFGSPHLLHLYGARFLAPTHLPSTHLPAPTPSTLRSIGDFAARARFTPPATRPAPPEPPFAPNPGCVSALWSWNMHEPSCGWYIGQYPFPFAHLT